MRTKGIRSDPQAEERQAEAYIKQAEMTRSPDRRNLPSSRTASGSGSKIKSPRSTCSGGLPRNRSAKKRKNLGLPSNRIGHSPIKCARLFNIALQPQPTSISHPILAKWVPVQICAVLRRLTRLI